MNTVGFPGLGIGPISFYPYITIFGLDIYWYGIIIAFGMILALVYAFLNAKKFGIDPDKIVDVAIIGLLGGIIGARLYYVVFNWSVFAGNPLSIFDIRSGGLAIYGGIIGAVICGGLTCRWRKVKFLPMLDIAGIGFLLGQGIGRWGNFINEEAYGCHTDLPWGMAGDKIPDAIAPVHPTFLYESIWCLIGFVLLAFYAKHRKFDGEVFLFYLMWYGFERFFVEGLRMDSLWLIPDVVRVSQLLSAILFIGAATLWIIMKRKMAKNPQRNFLYVHSEEWKKVIESKKKKAVKNK